MSFSFDFAVSTDPTDQVPNVDCGAKQDKDASPGTTEELLNASRNHLVPFSWLSNVAELLERRRQEQIIYEDICLEASVVEEEDTGLNGIPAVLRCVDLTRSSFHEETIDPGSTSDLVPGVYEGGLKVWESSIDLVQHLQSSTNSPGFLATAPHNTNEPMRFLELGCGHGLPLCYILQTAAKRGLLHRTQVVALDYNDYVLKDCTLSNIVLNLADYSNVPSEELAKSIKMGSGDWLGVLSSGAEKFDWIVAAETLYTVEAARETALLLSRLLRPGSGHAWVASKRYYFGVGGGVDAFREAAKALSVVTAKEDDVPYNLHVETVKVYDNGKANIRELLHVCLKAV